jgi:hypothetical protein
LAAAAGEERVAGKEQGIQPVAYDRLEGGLDFLAPLLLPVIFSALLSSFQGGWPVLTFLLLLAPACILSYGTTIFLFLPCLFLLSLWQPMTSIKACLLGLVLGVAMLVPLTWMEWKSSGPDSGPPTKSFLELISARSP